MLVRDIFTFRQHRISKPYWNTFTICANRSILFSEKVLYSKVESSIIISTPLILFRTLKSIGTLKSKYLARGYKVSWLREQAAELTKLCTLGNGQFLNDQKLILLFKLYPLHFKIGYETVFEFKNALRSFATILENDLNYIENFTPVLTWDLFLYCRFKIFN